MKKKRYLKTLNKFTVIATMICSSIMAIPVHADISSETVSNKAVSDALVSSDVIDMSQKGSISIYKYDSTSARRDGVWELGDDGVVTLKDEGVTYTVRSTGEQNLTAQRLLADYAVQGVEFSYVHCGDVETYSYTSGDTSKVNVVYEIDKELADILSLKETEAYDMEAEGVAYKCTSDKLHYDSSQLTDALSALIGNGDTEAKNMLEEYAESNLTGKFDKTDADGYTHVEDLDLGMYLIVETEVPEEVTVTCEPWFVSLPFTNRSDSDVSAQDEDRETAGTKWLYDIVCYPKNQTGMPTIDKMVRNAYGNIDPDGISSFDTDYIVSSFDEDTGASDPVGFVNDRNNEEGIDEYKYGDTTTASQGDILDYSIVSKLPTISSAATYLTRYTFTDTLSKGITYNKDARIAIYNNEADAVINNTKNAVLAMDLENADISLSNEDQTYTAGSPNAAWLYSQNYVNYNVINHASDLKYGETTLTVSFTDEGLKMINEGLAQSSDILDYGDYAYTDENGDVVLNEEGFGDYYMVIYYTATVNSDAQVILGDNGNPNDVTLEWERTSEGYTDTLEDRCYVYSFGLELTKYFSDKKGDLSNVKFIIYNATDGYYVVADNRAEESEENIYYTGGQADIEDTLLGKTVSKNKATVFTPNEAGKLNVYGLEADTYYLIEIQTDNGYKLLKDPVVIEIDTATREIRPSSAGYVGNDNAESSHVHDETCLDEAGNMICGIAADENANGRPIGKTAMYVGQSGDDFVLAKAKVDGVDIQMKNDIIDTASTDAIVNLEITNTKVPELPATGGNGTLIFTLAGCGAAFAGIMVAVKKKK